MPAKQTAAWSCHPATADRWDDLETLFGDRGACGGCWCMYWRRRKPDFDTNKGAGNRKALRKLVHDDREPGLIGYLGDEPVGWVAVAPREEYVRLGGSRILKPVDDTPVWSVSCLFVRKDYRRQGLSVRLLQAAVEFVRGRGGQAVEGYPVEPKTDSMPAPFAWTGLASAFFAAGFREVARRADTRPIVRYELADQ
jgi:GNAT superfamily N-acetyltransferase